MKSKLNKKELMLWCLLIGIVFLYHFQFGFSSASDDGWFKEVKSQYSLLEYLIMRYNVWSSRILPETILYYIFHLPVVFWRVINTFFVFLLSFSLARLFKEKITIREIILIIILLGFASFDVLESSFFWMTGSVNYLWPMALGAFTLIPFADHFFRNKKTELNLSNVVRIFTALLFSITNEQILVCALGVVISYHIYLFVKKIKPNTLLIIISIILLAGFLFMYFAPGNKLRYASEVKTWFPEFDNMSLISHIKVGVFWLFKQTITHMKFFIALISIITITLMKNTRQRTIFILFSLIMVSLTIKQPNLLFDFQLIHTVNLKQLFTLELFFSRAFVFGIFPFIVWTMFLTHMIYTSCKVSKYPLFTFLCYLAGILSCVLMFFSPTIYASGPRVLSSLMLFLIIISFNLLQQIIQFKAIEKRNLYFILSVFSIISFIFK